MAIYSSAQKSLVGKWYSDDSTRTYEIYAHGTGYQAVLITSTRKNENIGALVLTDINCNKKCNNYKGFIRAVSDGLTVQVKISLENDGNTMKLKLRRMILFPVYLQWKRVQ